MSEASPSLIAVLTVLWDASRYSRAHAHPAEWALADTLYSAIARELESAAGSAQNDSAHGITITIDLRRGDPAPQLSDDASDQPDGDADDEPPGDSGPDTPTS